MAVEDPLSKYDDITSEDLFESFMDVAISVEKEIKGDVTTDNHINGHTDDLQNRKKNGYHDDHETIDTPLYAKTKHVDTEQSRDLHLNGSIHTEPEINGTNDGDSITPTAQITPTVNEYRQNNNNIENIEEESYCVPGSIISSAGVTQRPNELTPSSNESEQDIRKDLYAIPKKDYPLITPDYKPIVTSIDQKNESLPNDGAPTFSNISKTPDDSYCTVNETKIDSTDTNTNNFKLQTQESIYSTPYATSNDISLVLRVEDIAFSRRSKTNVLENKKSDPKQRSANPSSGQKKKFFGKSKSSENSKARHKSWSGAKINDSMDVGSKSSTMPKPSEGNPIIISGFMFKQGGSGFTPKNWKLRWFVLKEDHCLYYFKSQGETVPLGAVMLLNYDVVNALEVNKSFAFKLIKGGARTYYFAVNSEDEKQKWKKHLHEAASSARTNNAPVPECSLKNVSIPAMSITEPDCHGHIMKQGQSHKSWKKRYCVLKYGCLFYYENMSDTVAIGVFKLHDYTFYPSDTIKNGIEAVPPGRKMRTYFFCMENKTECKRWIEAFKYSVASSSK